MKGHARMVGLILCLLTVGWRDVTLAGRTAGGDGKPVTLVFDDAPIPQVLRALAEHQRLNLVIAPDIKGNISLNLHNVSWLQAVDLIARTGRLRLERQDDALMVFPARRGEADGPPGETPLRNQLVTLEHADAGEVAKSIGSMRGALMSPRGSVMLDKRTNSLVLRDTDAALSALTGWIKIWDLPLEQVMITAHIVTISRDNLREIGVKWQQGGGTSPCATRLGVDLPLSEHYASMGFRLARLSGRLLELELTALEQENKVDILASPRLYTAHQQTASIKQGTEIPYQVANGKNKSPAIQFKEAVLSMEVTPKILRNGKVTLNLRLSQNVPGRVIKQGENESVSIDMEEIKTQVTIADGETIVLGGIFQHQKHQTHDRVPLLAEIPLLGQLFKRQRAHYKQRELVIFITPTRITG
ncbi:type IV pilus secretin PilQ [Sodalis sp. C49]|uniref:type IV pilus secretin PilQ n=1 Tax=Sodalis sp. C49 TaxID=3228929 RepID=UPI0039659174